jgi:hypothetical protein
LSYLKVKSNFISLLKNPPYSKAKAKNILKDIIYKAIITNSVIKPISSKCPYIKDLILKSLILLIKRHCLL